MRENHNFHLRRKGKPLTPDRLIKILRNVDVKDRADETYKHLTGLEPPSDDDEIIVEVDE